MVYIGWTYAASMIGSKSGLAVSKTMGSLLAGAVQSAPVVPEFYREVAAALIEADRQNGETFAVPLKERFCSPRDSHRADGVLPSCGNYGGHDGSRATRSCQRPASSGSRWDGVCLGPRSLVVHVATQARRVVAIASGRGGGTVTPPSSDRAARTFVDHLVRLGRIDYGGHGIPGAYVAHPRARKTHRIERLPNGALALRRILFYCRLAG
jgi:hypothetical protein